MSLDGAVDHVTIMTPSPFAKKKEAMVEDLRVFLNLCAEDSFSCEAGFATGPMESPKLKQFFREFEKELGREQLSSDDLLIPTVRLAIAPVAEGMRLKADGIALEKEKALVKAMKVNQSRMQKKEDEGRALED
ncbi:hypothetical protein MBANPS3_012351 [Mucor bainieri]